MKRFPLAEVIVFAVLTAAGVAMAAAPISMYGFNQAVLTSLGSAMFASSLSFFLVEMFRWNRDRAKN